MVSFLSLVAFKERLAGGTGHEATAVRGFFWVVKSVIYWADSGQYGEASGFIRKVKM